MTWPLTGPGRSREDPADAFSERLRRPTANSPRATPCVVGARVERHRSPRRLNFLSSDALAAAILTESSVAVRTDSPPLREACDALHVPYRIFEKR